MPDKDHDGQRDVLGLIRASGLRLEDDEAQQVVALYRRFAHDREALASADLGETEPALVFLPPGEEDER